MVTLQTSIIGALTWPELHDFIPEGVGQLARQLDTVAPGWEKEINLTTLNLHSPVDCVLGQVFRKHGNRFDGSAYLFGLGKLQLRVSSVAGYLTAANEALPAWYEEIKARRTEQHAA